MANKTLSAVILGAALSMGCSTTSPQPKTVVNPFETMYHDAVSTIRSQGQQIEGRCEPLYVLPLGPCDGYQQCDAIATNSDESFLIRAQGDKSYRLSFLAFVGGLPRVTRSYAGDGSIPAEVNDWLIPDHYTTPSPACSSFSVVHVYASNKAREPLYGEKKTVLRLWQDLVDGSWVKNLPTVTPAPAPVATPVPVAAAHAAPKQKKPEYVPSVEIWRAPAPEADTSVEGKEQASKKPNHTVAKRAHAKKHDPYAGTYVVRPRNRKEIADKVNAPKVQEPKVTKPKAVEPKDKSITLGSCPGYSSCSVSVMENGVITMKMSDWWYRKMYVGDMGGLSSVYETDLLMNPAGTIMAMTGIGLRSNNRGPIEAMRRSVTDANRAEFNAMLTRATKEAMAKKKK